jgi:hypothetical protein
MSMFTSDRRFKLWDCRVSHNQLLIRSPATPEIPTNIDVIFWGVEFVSVPTNLNGLAIERQSDGSNIGIPISPSPNGERFLIESNGKCFAVVAAGFKVLENSLDIFESSLEGFAATQAGRDLGNVLAHS